MLDKLKILTLLDLSKENKSLKLDDLFKDLEIKERADVIESFRKKGGILIVEDIFRERSIEPYEKIFEEVKHLVSFHTFITCDHALRYSPGWNNDKLLVFVKN
jgi:hypothetical protein